MTTQQRVVPTRKQYIAGLLLAFWKGSSNAGRSSDVYISCSRVTGSVNMWNKGKEEMGRKGKKNKKNDVSRKALRL